MMCNSFHMDSKIHCLISSSVHPLETEAHPLWSFWKFAGVISLIVKLLGGTTELVGRDQEY